MTQFQLFDVVKLKESIQLSESSSEDIELAQSTAPEGTPGTIVEVFNDGEAYLVELFGGWVKYDEQGDFVPSSQTEAGSFMETLGIETVYPSQIRLVTPAREVMGARGHLSAILEDLSEELVAEVRDFAEFLQQKQERRQA